MSNNDDDDYKPTQEVERFYRDLLLREQGKRFAKSYEIIQFIEANFVFHRRARIKPNMIYEAVSQALKIANGPPLKRYIRNLLMTNYNVTQTHGSSHGRCFVGVGYPEYLEWRIEKDKVDLANFIARGQEYNASKTKEEVAAWRNNPQNKPPKKRKRKMKKPPFEINRPKKPY